MQHLSWLQEEVRAVPVWPFILAITADESLVVRVALILFLLSAVALIWKKLADIVSEMWTDITRALVAVRDFWRYFRQSGR
jgi:hypothetical protein